MFIAKNLEQLNGKKSVKTAKVNLPRSPNFFNPNFFNPTLFNPISAEWGPTKVGKDPARIFSCILASFS